MLLGGMHVCTYLSIKYRGRQTEIDGDIKKTLPRTSFPPSALTPQGGLCPAQQPSNLTALTTGPYATTSLCSLPITTGCGCAA